jgi:hypothetical protein
MKYEKPEDINIENNISKLVEETFKVHVWKDYSEFAPIDFFVTNAFMEMVSLMEVKGRVAYNSNSFKEGVFIPLDKIDYIYKHAFNDYPRLNEVWYVIQWKDKVTMAKILREHEVFFKNMKPQTATRQRESGNTTNLCHLIPLGWFKALDEWI